MTRRHRTLAAALAVAALTSCSLNLDMPPTTPAPPTRIVAPPTTIAAPSTIPQTQTSSTAPETATATATFDQDLVDDGAPTNQTVLSNPQFALDAIDLSSPEQVAWAYLTERLSYSYRDTQPGAGVARAARYLARDAATQAPPPATGDPAQDAQWAAAVTARTVANTTVSRLTTFHPDATAAGAEALVVADWNRVLSNNTGAPLRSSGTATMTLKLEADGHWLVSDPGLGTAG